MTYREFSTLRSYARTFARTEDDADELVLLAYRESLRLGARSTLRILVNYMRLCAKSIRYRSFLTLEEGGKSRLDAFSREKRYLSDAVADGLTLEGVIAADSADPFDDCVSAEFVASLSPRQSQVLSELMAGYSVREICRHLRVSSKTFEAVRASLRELAGKHLLAFSA